MPTPFTGLRGPRLATPYLSLSESTYVGGLRQARHGHDPAYLTAVVDGAYDERIGCADRAVLAGALLFHPSGEEHAVRFTAPRTTVFRLEPTSHMLAETRLAGGDLSRLGLGFSREAAARVVRLLRRAWRGRDALAPLVVDALACELIAATARPPRRRDAVDRGAVRRVRDLLEADASRPPALAALATHAGCHPVTLARAFRQVMGCSIGAYLRRRRIARAVWLLQGSDEPISLVAHRAGFADQQHATRALRRATGLTPAAIRGGARPA